MEPYRDIKAHYFIGTKVGSERTFLEMCPNSIALLIYFTLDFIFECTVDVHYYFTMQYTKETEVLLLAAKGLHELEMVVKQLQEDVIKQTGEKKV